MTEFRLPRPVVTRLLTHAQGRPDTEVCGLIAARDGVPCRVYPVANAAYDPERLFAMDPAGQIDAMRAMRERGETLWAIYHSHPHAPPAPSATDLREAAYPEALYLIVSLNTKGVLELRGYRLEEKRFVAAELALEEAQ